MGAGEGADTGKEEPMRQAPAGQGPGEPPEVARLARLHHRRRGWAWVALGSLTGLLMYLAVGVNVFGNLSGTAEDLSVIPVFVLLALVPAGLAVAAADTVRIRRSGAALRASAQASVAHRPLYAHAHRYPPRHFGSWVFGMIMLLAMTVATVALLPAEVNAVAYLAGAESRDTFHPLGYNEACGRSGCHTVTDGFLSGSGADVTWNSDVPLGQPFTVGVPVWNWGTGRNLISGAGTAIAVAAVGLFFNGVAIVLLAALIAVARHTRARRRQGTAAAAGGPAGTARLSHAEPGRGGPHGPGRAGRAGRQPWCVGTTGL
jgi:hypothetical protein